VRFNWLDREDKNTRVGFIAQDVERVLPEVVHPGDTYAIETSQVTAVLVEAVKEQQRQIEGLKFLLGILFISFTALVLFVVFRKKRFLLIENNP